MLVIIIKKLFWDLRLWYKFPMITNISLQLFSEISSGFNSGKLLSKIKGLKEILFMNHSCMEFLNYYDNFKYGGKYYAILTRLLFVEENGEEEKEFLTFLEPFLKLTNECDGILNVSQCGNYDCLHGPLNRLFRDYRAICSSLISKKNYSYFFEWIYPRLCEVLIKGFHVCIHNPKVTVSGLKFFNEFCLNRSQRLNFDITSAHGILIFRVVGRLISYFGAFNSSSQIAQSYDIYKRYKAISCCFSIIKTILSGRFVNIGILKLYNDPVLDETREAIFNMIDFISSTDYFSYPKHARNYYSKFKFLI
jgi:exportin-7